MRVTNTPRPPVERLHVLLLRLATPTFIPAPPLRLRTVAGRPRRQDQEKQ